MGLYWLVMFSRSTKILLCCSTSTLVRLTKLANTTILDWFLSTTGQDNNLDSVQKQVTQCPSVPCRGCFCLVWLSSLGPMCWFFHNQRWPHALAISIHHQLESIFLRWNWLPESRSDISSRTPNCLLPLPKESKWRKKRSRGESIERALFVTDNDIVESWYGQMLKWMYTYTV